MRNGVTFRSLAQSIDTRTPEGRKWYIDAANSAEYERAVKAAQALVSRETMRVQRGAVLARELKFQK